MSKDTIIIEVKRRKWKLMTSTELEYPGKEGGVDSQIPECERSLPKLRIMLYL